MLNEWQEFLDYTQPVRYTAIGKKDATWLGRFSFDALRDFGGLTRILTILARGFLFHDEEGKPLSGDPRQRIEYAQQGLCAWCSISEKKREMQDWEYTSCFPELHDIFPMLVDADGHGWFCRHFCSAMAFASANPSVVTKNCVDIAPDCLKKFDTAWRNKVIQFQTPPFHTATKGAWTLRFDDVLADALELGPLRSSTVQLPDDLKARICAILPEKMPAEMAYTLVAYYIANKPDDSDWVVLPVINFDCWFCNTNFSRKYLPNMPPTLIERSRSSFGVSRCRVLPEYLP